MVYIHFTRVVTTSLQYEGNRCIHKYTHIYIYKHTHTHTCTYTYTHTYIIHTDTIHTNANTHGHTHIHTHTHTHTHIHTSHTHICKVTNMHIDMTDKSKLRKLCICPPEASKCLHGYK